MSILPLITVVINAPSFTISYKGKTETFTESAERLDKQSCLSCVLCDYRFTERYTAFDLENYFKFSSWRAQEIMEELKELSRKVDNLFTLEDINELIHEV